MFASADGYRYRFPLLSSPLLSSPPRRSWPKGRINNQADRRDVVIWREGHFARHYPDEKGMTRKKSFVTLFGARKSVSLVGSISISPMKSWPNKRLAQTADHAANHSIRTNRHCLSHREESSLVAQHSKKCVTTADSLTRASGRPLRLSNQRKPIQTPSTTPTPCVSRYLEEKTLHSRWRAAKRPKVSGSLVAE